MAGVFYIETAKREELDLTRLFSYFASLILHAGFFFLLKGAHHETQSPPIKNRLEVDLVSPLPKSSTSTNQSVTSSSSPPAETGKINAKESPAQALESLSLRQLLPPLLGHSSSVSDQSKSERGEVVRDAHWQMNAMGVEEAVDLLPFFSSIWEKIDKNLLYPEDFSNQRIKGNVNLSLELDSRGVWTGIIHQISAENVYLKAYVLAVLTQTLKTPVSEKLWLKDQQKMAVGLSFHFGITELHIGQIENRKIQFKNALLFERINYVDPYLNQKLQEIFTRYIPPIIPIPGGFYIDFVQAYRMVKNWGEPSEEEKRKQRIKSFKADLEQTILRAESR